MSFDVKSLFTNIPLEFTTNIILTKLFPDKATTVFGMNKKEFRKLLMWTTTNSTFQFNNCYYKQIDGVAMGSPLAPAFADICMNWLLEEVNKQSNFSFTIYRYVDDLFLAFDNFNQIESIFTIFNSIHEKIKFTKEIETNNQISFLDIYITKTDDNIQTKIYRKPTYTGLYTKWDSYIPLKHKKSLVFSLLHRAFHICSDYKIMHKEFQFITSILQNNGYPLYFVNKCISTFLNKKFTTKIESTDSNSQLVKEHIFLSNCRISTQFPIKFTKKLIHS